jgi:hypothetical protein
MLSLKRTAQTLKALTGRAIAEAALPARLTRLHEALAGWETAAIEALLAEPALHADETSLRIDRKQHWLHSVSAGNPVPKHCHLERGGEALRDIGIVPRYGGVPVHDRRAGYVAFENCAHALCATHLLRNLAFIEQAHGQARAKRMGQLLPNTCRKVRRQKNKALGEPDCKALRTRYRTVLTQAGRELPAPPDAHHRPARTGCQIRRREPARGPYQVRNRGAALRPQPRRAVHQPPRRARYPQGQGQTERLRLLPHPPLRRRLLPHHQLLAVHGLPGLQSPRRHRDRTQRQCRQHGRETATEQHG